jgi:glutaredoxin-like protein NrdH
MTVTVLSKPACGACNATYRTLDSKGIEYEVLDFTSDDPRAAELYAQAKERGLMSAPVVFAGDDVWSGFKVEKINELAAKLAA